MARLPYVIPYDPEFLGDGFQVPLIHPVCNGKLVQCGRVFDYIHFSLVMHQDRRTALYTAHNIDTAERKSVPRTDWDLDPRISQAYQTGGGAYFNNPWDRGHLVRRAAVAWGSHQEALDASDSSFYYTNAAPQHERFNQDEWLKLEDWVLQAAGEISSRLCVFTGPIYTLRDKFHDQTRIPSAFWKVVLLRDPTAGGDDLSAIGFAMKQNKLWDDWNGAAMLDLELYQVGITEIGGYTGLDFGELAALDEFEWRQPRFRQRSLMQPIRITKPEDIRFFGDRRRARGIRALRAGRAGDGESLARLTEAKAPCDCGSATGPLEERVETLASQITVLQELVEALMGDGEDGEEEQRALRSLAHQRFARIVGGVMTGANEFPECACIGANGHWFCSGILIHERVVLTAAHCAPAINQVYLGGRSLNLIGSMGEVVNVERVVVHPDYDRYLVPSHDIAVLILEEAATASPVELATEDEVNSEDNVILVGFGYDHPTQAVGFGTKRRVDVPLTNLGGFTEPQITDIEQRHGFDTDFEFHAGRKELGKDSCNGDSGGPAYILVGDSYKLAGITSRAAFSSELPCGDGGVYTRITPYSDWIGTATGGLVGNDEPDSEEPTSSGVYISAAQPNPAGPDQGNEWVEITNASQQDVPLASHFIADKQGGRHELGGVLSSGATRREVLPGDSPVKLANQGDEIILLHNDIVLHQVSYEGAGSGEIIRFQLPDPPPDDDTPDDDLIDADPC